MTTFSKPPVTQRVIKTKEGAATKPARATRTSSFRAFDEGEGVMKKAATSEMKTAKARGAAWSFASTGQPRNNPAVAQAIRRVNLDPAPRVRYAAAARGTVVRNMGNSSLE